MAGRQKHSGDFIDSEERKTPNKERRTEQGLRDLKTGYAIATRVQKAFKRWKTLEKEIRKKQAKVEGGGQSKLLKPYRNERDELYRQLQDDIPDLELILEDKYDKAFNRNERRRATDGANRKEKSVPEIDRLNNMEPRLYQGEVDISNLKQELHDYNQDIQVSFYLLEVYVSKLSTDNEKPDAERTDSKASLRDELEAKRRTISQLVTKDKSLEEENTRLKEELKRKSEDNEKVTLKHGYQQEIENLKEEIRRLEKRIKEHEQIHYPAAQTEWNKKYALVKEECENLRKKLDESENEKAALNIDHTEKIEGLQEEMRRLKKRHTEECRELEKQTSEINARCSSFQDEITRLTISKSSYEKTEKELSRLTTKCKELEVDIESYMENWKKSDDAKIQLEIKLKEKENAVKELEKKLEEEEDEIKVWKNRYNSLEQEKRSIEQELTRVEANNNQLTRQLENERKAKEDTILRLEAKNNQLTSQLDNERKAKEDALLRLSSMASNKLRDNNPNIADLSDPNRPTKLSEQFSELYDNEWTDAFDELEKSLGDKDDKKIISYLRDFVLEIHLMCSDLSSSKLKTIEEAFVKPSVPSKETKVPSEIIKTIKDGIKSMAPKLLEHVKECVLEHLKSKFSTEPVADCLQSGNMKRYIDKCTEVCWYMSVQDPQLVMEGDPNPDGKFDSNKHREYTKKGQYEEFVVWPVLYLYRGGQMLSKGVAQGAKNKMN